MIKSKSINDHRTDRKNDLFPCLFYIYKRPDVRYTWIIEEKKRGVRQTGERFDERK